MADYTDFVSFDVPQWIIDQGGDPEELKLDGENLDAVKQALEELMSTPEGEALIKQAAADAPDGKVNIIFLEGGYTVVPGEKDTNDIILGTKDSSFQYHSPETGGHHDISIQRVMFHELQHIAAGHTSSTKELEADAIKSTNDFMKKYYDEPERNLDVYQLSEDGTPKWDINPNFNQNGHAEPQASAQETVDLGGQDGTAYTTQATLGHADLNNIQESMDTGESIITSAFGVSAMSEDAVLVNAKTDLEATDIANSAAIDPSLQQDTQINQFGLN